VTIIKIKQFIGCVIQIKELGQPEPLILNPDQKTFLRPSDSEGTLKLKYNQKLYLACPGTKNYLIQKQFGREAEATCIGGKQFQVKGHVFSSNKLVCYEVSVFFQIQWYF
jgi:hypothetical protein